MLQHPFAGRKRTAVPLSVEPYQHVPAVPYGGSDVHFLALAVRRRGIRAAIETQGIGRGPRAEVGGVEDPELTPAATAVGQPKLRRLAGRVIDAIEPIERAGLKLMLAERRVVRGRRPAEPVGAGRAEERTELARLMGDVDHLVALARIVRLGLVQHRGRLHRGLEVDQVVLFAPAVLHWREDR